MLCSPCHQGTFLITCCVLAVLLLPWDYHPLSCAAQVLLSCNILGNPIGVFTSLGTGVRDFFKHPAEGAVVSPADFALGVGEWRSPFVVSLLCPCCAHAVPMLCPCCNLVASSAAKSTAPLPQSFTTPPLLVDVDPFGAPASHARWQLCH